MARRPGQKQRLSKKHASLMTTQPLSLFFPSSSPALLHRGFAAATPRSPPPPRRSVTAATASSGAPPSAAATAAYLASVGVPGPVVAALERDHPDCLAHGLEGVIKPKVGLLLGEVVGGDGVALGAVLGAVPRVLNAELDTGLARTVGWLRGAESLGLRAAALKRIALARPQILTYDVDKTLAPKAAFFTADLGVPLAGLRRMVAASPDVLVIGLGNDLKPTVAWLESLGFARHSPALVDLLVHHPTIFHNPLETAKKNVKALGEWGVPAEGVRAILAASPSLFRRSVTSPSNTAKLAYWEAAVQRDRAAIASDAPNLFERSLARVVGPRLDAVGSRAALPVNLRPLMDGTDAAWAATYGDGSLPPVAGWAMKNKGRYSKTPKKAA